MYKLSFKLLVKSVAQITKIVPPFLWFQWRGTNLTPGGGLCYNHRRIRHCGGQQHFWSSPDRTQLVLLSLVEELRNIIPGNFNIDGFHYWIIGIVNLTSSRCIYNIYIFLVIILQYTYILHFSGNCFFLVKLQAEVLLYVFNFYLLN